MAGYSGTPLAAKLGIQSKFKVFASGAPANYRALLAPLPPSVRFTPDVDASTDLAHVFTTRSSELSQALATFRKTLKPDAMVWVSWPKKSAHFPSEVTEDTVRELALPLGFVDVKVCAIDDVWSGLKLVVRKELRSGKGATTKKTFAATKTATPAGKKAISLVDDPAAVDAYMKKLKHPLKAEIQALRAVIRGANKKLSERIKWNAPSYFYGPDMAAFNPRSTKFVQLVFIFPHGIVKDSSGLLQGKWKDRREARFTDMADVRAKSAALKRIVNAWVKLVDTKS